MNRRKAQSVFAQKSGWGAFLWVRQPPHIHRHLQPVGSAAVDDHPRLATERLSRVPAARVSPPGMMKYPVSGVARKQRSTACRGAMRPSTRAGPVEKAMASCPT